MAYKDKDLIKVVSGLRRSGKSTLFELYRQTLLQMGVPASQIVFLNFEDFELHKFLNDLDALYAYIIGNLDVSKPSYVFLDEIQNVYEFECLVDCHYYTFSKTDKSAIIETLADQGNPLWVVAVNVKEANFSQVTSNVKVGDIVLYQVPSDGGVRLSHSGIVSGVDTQGFATEITSKMGEYEIIKHHPRDVPSDYGPTNPTFQSGGQTHLSRIYYRRR